MGHRDQLRTTLLNHQEKPSLAVLARRGRPEVFTVSSPDVVLGSAVCCPHATLIANLCCLETPCPAGQMRSRAGEGGCWPLESHRAYHVTKAPEPGWKESCLTFFTIPGFQDDLAIGYLSLDTCLQFGGCHEICPWKSRKEYDFEYDFGNTRRLWLTSSIWEISEEREGFMGDRTRNKLRRHKSSAYPSVFLVPRGRCVF